MPSAMRVPSLSESEQLQHFRHALLRLALKYFRPVFINPITFRHVDLSLMSLDPLSLHVSMALHPSKYGITRAISSLKTQKANEWHYPFWSILFILEAEKAQLALNSPMGLMNVLKFSAACFDLLVAEKLGFALISPCLCLHWVILWKGLLVIIIIIINIISVLHRCASIRAIETNSISDVRKLVAYWVLFSLISLFDHTFAKLLEW
ncbi:hypothetical protein CK203_113784 [Vitis vinifera]|uniref:Uncharacterized protein n=1 Tax=Vitis vinifera TaxID=29760 RepID=A0A438DL50_VITVI|nr:hypothetical protein CK203_113784 [Vitis vinifera]